MTDDELAAAIAAIQSATQQPDEAPQPRMSAWKRQARLESVLRQDRDDDVR